MFPRRRWNFLSGLPQKGAGVRTGRIVSLQWFGADDGQVFKKGRFGTKHTKRLTCCGNKDVIVCVCSACVIVLYHGDQLMSSKI